LGELSGYSSHVVGRVLFFKIPEGSHPHEEIAKVLEENDIRAAVINGIGGFAKAVVGVYSPEEKRYYEEEVVPEEKRVLEVVALNGNSVRGPDGKYYTHLHVALAKGPNNVYAGHLIDAVVRPFLEVAIIELVGDLARIQALLSHRWKPS
jgi:predicted DNA-binding protein with PD1-like motif